MNAAFEKSSFMNDARLSSMFKIHDTVNLLPLRSDCSSLSTLGF